MERFPKALGSMCDVFFEVPENGNWEGKDDVILGEVGMATWTLYISFGWVYGLQLSSLTKHAIRRCIAFIIFRQNPESDCISKLRSAGILDDTTSMSFATLSHASPNGCRLEDLRLSSQRRPCRP